VAALVLARDLRRSGVRCEVDTRGSSLKSQLRRANALGAKVALILGESELAGNAVQIKDLEGRTQALVARDETARVVATRIASGVPAADARSAMATPSASTRDPAPEPEEPTR
jgi:histidyl-tRNA synthetase